MSPVGSQHSNLLSGLFFPLKSLSLSMNTFHTYREGLFFCFISCIRLSPRYSIAFMTSVAHKNSECFIELTSLHLLGHFPLFKHLHVIFHL